MKLWYGKIIIGNYQIDKTCTRDHYCPSCNTFQEDNGGHLLFECPDLKPIMQCVYKTPQVFHCFRKLFFFTRIEFGRWWNFVETPNGVLGVSEENSLIRFWNPFLKILRKMRFPKLKRWKEGSIWKKHAVTFWRSRQWKLDRNPNQASSILNSWRKLSKESKMGKKCWIGWKTEYHYQLNMKKSKKRWNKTLKCIRVLLNRWRC